MRKGFLAPPQSCIEQPAPATTATQADDADPQRDQPGPAVTAPYVGPEVGTQQWQENFEQCLALLKGPGDERRFVGLLLVTRLLPAGSDDAIRSVLDALGFEFLDRLLLPVVRQTQVRRMWRTQATARHPHAACYLSKYVGFADATGRASKHACSMQHIRGTN